MAFPPSSTPSFNPLNAALSSPINLVQATRDPGVNDVSYQPGQSEWLNTSNGNYWKYKGVQIVSGNAQAVWELITTVVETRDPTSADNTYTVGTFWSNTTTDNFWTLTSFPSAGVARWVQLTSGTTSVDLFAMQTGTTPIGPNGSGIVTFSGAVVDAGANPVRTDGTAATTMTLEVQKSQAIAAPDSTKVGLSSFNSAHFTVDADAFVSLAGAGLAIDSFQPDTGTNPVVPTAAGLVKILGQNPASTSGIRVTGGTNELDIAMFSPFVGSFVFTDSSAGAQSVQVINTNAAGTAEASVISQISTTGLAAYTNWNVNGVAAKNWSAGLLQSDSSWYLHQSNAAFPSNPIIKATTAGCVTKPLQPAFCSILNTSSGAVTGDGTTWSFGTTGGGTLVTQFDQGSNLSIVATVVRFTAPVTGKYRFQASLEVGSISAAMTTGSMQFNNLTTGAYARVVNLNSANCRNASNILQLSGSAFIDMTAGDIVTLSVQLAGGALAATINGTTTFLSFFTGQLEC